MMAAFGGGMALLEATYDTLPPFYPTTYSHIYPLGALVSDTEPVLFILEAEPGAIDLSERNKELSVRHFGKSFHQPSSTYHGY